MSPLNSSPRRAGGVCVGVEGRFRGLVSGMGVRQASAVGLQGIVFRLCS